MKYTENTNSLNSSLKPEGIEYHLNYKETGIPGVSWSSPLDNDVQCAIYLNNNPIYTTWAKEGGCAFPDLLKQPRPGDILIIRAYGAGGDEWSDPYTVPGEPEPVRPSEVAVILDTNGVPTGMSWQSPASDRVQCYPEASLNPVGSRVLSAIKRCTFNSKVYPGQQVYVVGVRTLDGFTEQSLPVTLPVWGDNPIPEDSPAVNTVSIRNNRLYWRGIKLGASGGSGGYRGLFMDIGLMSMFKEFSQCQTEADGFYSIPISTQDIPQGVPFRFAIEQGSSGMPSSIVGCSIIFRI